MTKIAKTKIEWCDITWNPAWGCRRNCEYCYARKMARRFGDRIYEKELTFSKAYIPHPKINPRQTYINFQPVFIHSNFHKIFPMNKDMRIFVNSMSDIFFWHTDWMYKVLGKIADWPQHRFIFLTKYPQIYDKYEFPKNCYLGITITGKEENASHLYSKLCRHDKHCRFISFEPLLDHPLPIPKGWVDWIIVGRQTNPAVYPKDSWIEYLCDYSTDNNIPIFMKNNVKLITYNLIQRFPAIYNHQGGDK